MRQYTVETVETVDGEGSRMGRMVATDRGWLEEVRGLFEGLPDRPTVEQVDAALRAWGFEVDELNRAIVLGILEMFRLGGEQDGENDGAH